MIFIQINYIYCVQIYLHVVNLDNNNQLQQLQYDITNRFISSYLSGIII